MDPRNTLGRQFFENIKSEGVTFVKNLAQTDPPTYEGDWLDFKTTYEGVTRSPLSDEALKKIWWKSISGFANSGGGTLVWGILASKDDDDGLDRARERHPVHAPKEFENRLRGLARGATDPPVQNIEYWSADDPDEEGYGYVGCYIPPSQFKPHRVESKDKQFYIRVGDTTQPASVAILRSLFYPDANSVFEVGYEIVNNSRLNLSIHNIGIAPAKDVAIIVSSEGWGYSNWDCAREHWSHIRLGIVGTRCFLACQCQHLLYPGTFVEGVYALFKVEDMKRNFELRSLVFNVDIYCSNSTPARCIFEIHVNDFEDNVKRIVYALPR